MFVFEDGKLIVTPSQSLPNEPITIQVSGVADLFGNVLVSPFNQTFNPGDQGVLFSGGSDTGPVVVEESTIGNPFLFQGREWDPVAGLYYYRARYYDPHLMRFLSVDPEGYADSPNLYQGFLNNPMNNTDPLGRRVSDIQGCDPQTMNRETFFKCAEKQVGFKEAANFTDLVFTDLQSIQKGTLLATGVDIAGDEILKWTAKTYAAMWVGAITFGAGTAVMGTGWAAVLASGGLSGLTKSRDIRLA